MLFLISTSHPDPAGRLKAVGAAAGAKVNIYIYIYIYGTSTCT